MAIFPEVPSAPNGDVGPHPNLQNTSKKATAKGETLGASIRFNETGGVNHRVIITGKGMAQTIMNKPTRIEHGKVRCLILDAPCNDNLTVYIQEMRDFGVTDLVRTCELTYDEQAVEAAGIRTHEMVFGDGEAPSDDIICDWLRLVNDVASKKGAIGVHCVAGLGRAPVLVAVALVEKGMDPLDAITFIRERRKGAINRRQLQYLSGYKRRSRGDKCCCSIM